MTSTIGASFTSVSFLQTLVKPVGRHLALSTFTFITIATVAFLVLGTTPKSLLVFAGAFNGLILPFGLALVLWVANAAGSGGGRCGCPRPGDPAELSLPDWVSTPPPDNQPRVLSARSCAVATHPGMMA